MISTLISRLPDDPHIRIDRFGTGRFFGTVSLLLLLCALMYAGLAQSRPMPALALLVLTPLALAGLFGWMRLRVGSFAPALIGPVAAWGTLALVAVVSFSLGDGLFAGILGLVSLVICVMGVFSGTREAMRAALASGALVALLYSAQGFGWLPGARAIAEQSIWMRIGTLAMLIGTSLAASVLMSRVTAYYARAAHQRQERFRTLLRMSADWYWEMDARCRFIAPEGQAGGQNGPRAAALAGRQLWDLITPNEVDDDTLDELRADMESHRPFTGILMPWRDRYDRLRYLRVSGEPRFDRRGVFTGYWGVGIDASTEVGARKAVAESEARLGELFDRTPSPLLLHRGGIVIDANPATLDLLGLEDFDELLDHPLTDFVPPGVQTELIRQHMELLEGLPVGESLPEEDFELRAADGVRQVRLSGVRISLADGPATLFIGVDDTERLQAIAALRSSEGLLAELLRSSPDSITISEMDSGRYVIVNQAFERLHGYAAAEVVGRGIETLGDWADPAELRRMVDTVRRRGRISSRPTRRLAKDGRERLMMTSGASFELEGVAYLVLMSREISSGERTRLELDAVLEQATDGIALVRDGRFVHTNARFEELLGWPAGSLNGEAVAPVGLPDGGQLDLHPLPSGAPAPGSRANLDVEQELTRRDGTPLLCRVRGQAIGTRQPSLTGTVWIVQDVSRRQDARRALGVARNVLDAAERSRNRFIARAADEIRTPLQDLVSLAQRAHELPPGDDEREAGLRLILERAQALERTTADLLDPSHRR